MVSSHTSSLSRELTFGDSIFVLGTSGLGRHTRRAAALLVMGVSGGAVFPPIQGAIADKFSTRSSYGVVVPCFVYIALWAAYIWNKDGRIWSASGTKEINREVEASSGGVIPLAQVGLSYTGERTEYYEGSVEDVEKV